MDPNWEGKIVKLPFDEFSVSIRECGRMDALGLGECYALACAALPMPEKILFLAAGVSAIYLRILRRSKGR